MHQFPNLHITTKINIKCNNDREASSLYKSLKPDNINFPKDLQMDMELNEASVIINLIFLLKDQNENNSNINTLLSTIEEMMEHVGVIKEVINKND